MENTNIISIENYEKERLEIEQQEKILEKKRNELTNKRLTSIEKENKNINDKLEKIGVDVDVLKTDNEIFKKDNENFKKKIYILSNDSKAWREWRNKANLKILHICGNSVSSLEYLLFQASYRKWMYSDISKAVGAPCASKIYYTENDTSAYDASLVNMKNWYPDKYRKNRKMTQYMNDYNNNVLKEEKRLIWEKYLDKIQGEKR